MSFSRLNYDNCAYSKSLKESTSVGNYMLEQPKNDCEQCFFDSPNIRLSKGPVATCSSSSIIDIDSELMGLKRTASKCVKSPLPECNQKELKSCDSKFMVPEDTKLSNPPCTLRGTGWNRWEWLCEDPQKYAEVPFVTMISDKTLAKDNHRPLFPNVINTSNKISEDMSCMMDSPEIFGQEQTPFVHWRSCEEIAKY
jgi:hypothetical protein